MISNLAARNRLSSWGNTEKLRAAKKLFTLVWGGEWTRSEEAEDQRAEDASAPFQLKAADLGMLAKTALAQCALQVLSGPPLPALDHAIHVLIEHEAITAAWAAVPGTNEARQCRDE